MSCESACSLCTPEWYALAGVPTVRPLAEQPTPFAFTSSGAGYRGRKLRLCHGCANRATHADMRAFLADVPPTRRRRQPGPTIPLPLQYSDALE